MDGKARTYRRGETLAHRGRNYEIVHIRREPEGWWLNVLPEGQRGMLFGSICAGGRVAIGGPAQALDNLLRESAR